MLCKLMKHRGVNLDFLTQAISDNWDEYDQEETTTHHIDCFPATEWAEA